MLLNISIAAFIMVLTTAIHAGGMLLIMNAMHRRQSHLSHQWQKSNIYWVAGTVLVMFFVSLLEVLVWAYTFLLLNAIEGFEAALYFSMVTFTTLGYGDVLLEENWRLLGSFAAANGIIMFGWTTAIVLAVVQNVYYGDKHKSKHES